MKELTDQNFEQEVLQADQPVLVDFWKPGCPPCKKLAPIMEEVAEETQDEAKVGKLNVTKNPKSAQKYGIMGVPTLIIFKDSEAEEKAVGARPKKVILEKLRQFT